MNEIAGRYLEMRDPILPGLSLVNPARDISLVPVEGQGHVLRIAMFAGEVTRSLELVMDDEALGVLAEMIGRALRRGGEGSDVVG